MSDRSPQVDAAYELRDAIANAVIDFQDKFPGYRAVIDQDYSFESPHRAQLGQLRIEIVARDGTSKATTYRSLTE